MGLIGSLDSCVSALDAFRKGLEVVANNVANVNTIGFKSSKADYAPAFGNVLQRSVPSNGTATGGSNTTAMHIGNGVQLGAISTSYSQGPIEKTEKETDLALVGDGFFRVVDSVNHNTFVTRAGNFRVDDRNYLVTSIQGYRVQGMTMDKNYYAPSYTVDYQGGQFTVTRLTVSGTPAAPTVGDLKIGFAYDASSIKTSGSTGGLLVLTSAAQTARSTGVISDADILKAAPYVTSFGIDPRGRVNYTLSNGDTTTLNQIMATKVRDSQALVHEGEGLYSGFVAAGALPFDVGVSECGLNGIGEIRYKSLELSNVDLTKQFSNIITIQRAFQAAARGITVSDEVLNEVVNLKR